MNKNELIEKIQKLGDRIDEGRGRYSYEYDEYGLQAIISTVLDAVEEIRNFMPHEIVDIGGRGYTKMIVSKDLGEAINKLR